MDNRKSYWLRSAPVFSETDARKITEDIMKTVPPWYDLTDVVHMLAAILTKRPTEDIRYIAYYDALDED